MFLHVERQTRDTIRKFDAYEPIRHFFLILKKVNDDIQFISRSTIGSTITPK
jgi:hypothetical protein